MRRYLAIVSGLVFAFLASMAFAQNSGLRALEKREALLGWEAVGRVDIGGRGYCSGVLVATDLVLTAAHCVYDDLSGAAIAPSNLRFDAGWRSGKAIATRGVTAVAAHPEYQPKSGSGVQALRSDVALLKLDTPIPAATAAPFALHSGAKVGQNVSVVSYGRGRDAVLSWQRECSLLGRQAGVMAFDCDVTFGSSGAPVFVREGQRARILTLVSRGRKEGGKTIAFGMELGPAVAATKRALRAQRSTGAPRRIQLGGTARQSGAKFVRIGD